MPFANRLSDLLLTVLTLLLDTLVFLKLCFRSRSSLAAENLFLRKQLALYRERKVKPRRATDATRLALRISSAEIRDPHEHPYPSPVKIQSTLFPNRSSSRGISPPEARQPYYRSSKRESPGWCAGAFWFEYARNYRRLNF